MISIDFKVLYISFIYREQRWIFDTEVGYFPGQLTLISTGLFFSMVLQFKNDDLPMVFSDHPVLFY